MNNENKKVTPPARRSQTNAVKKRALVVLSVFILIIGAVAGSTLAWFTDTTDPVVNTFTVGDIDIRLEEDAGGEDKEFKMIPGHNIEKDPIAWVCTGSETCYLFVELKEDLGNKWSTYSPTQTAGAYYAFSDLLHYEIADGWEPLKVKVVGENDEEVEQVVPGVYYRVVTKNSVADQPFDVIKDHTVSVDYKITKEMMAMLEESDATLPTLTVKAYAIQYYKTNDTPFEPDEAWEALTAQIQH